MQAWRASQPGAPVPVTLPTLRAAHADYCRAKNIKASSQQRYESLFRTHFGDWQDRPVSDMGLPEFTAHCQGFAQTKGAALVELGRGVVDALIKYVNAMHGLSLDSPFTKLAAVGMLPARAQPRARVLQEADLPAWRAAVDQLGEPQRDFLLMTLCTGLRRNECRDLRRGQIDLVAGVLCVLVTKNRKPHSLPVTPMMREVLERRCTGLQDDDELFAGVSADHLSDMAARAGSPRFMLHDLRKLVATVGELLKVGDAVLRRILNHTAAQSDVLHRHYVGLSEADVAVAMVRIQEALIGLMRDARQGGREGACAPAGAA